MRKFLRDLLLSAIVGLSVPCMMAQSESFTGVSGKDYLVDYEAGLVMQLQNAEATLVSPVAVVETEFKPMLERTQIMASECETIFMQLDNCKMAIAQIKSMLDQMQYTSCAKQIQSLQKAQQSSENQEKSTICISNEQSVSASTDFSFGIDNTISSIGNTEAEIQMLMEYVNYINMNINEIIYYISSGSAPFDMLVQIVMECEMSVINVQESVSYTLQNIMMLEEKCTELNGNFASALFTGYNGEIFGMYSSIIDNDGVFRLPDTENSGGKEYHVTAVDGNIFSCVSPGVSLTALQLVLPSGINNIQNGAFAIDGISSVTVPTKEVPSIEENCFTTDVYQNAILSVPVDLVDAFKENPVWSKFLSLNTSGLDKDMIGGTGVRIEGKSIIVDGDAAVAVYTLDGRTVYTGCDKTIELPAKGLYIVKAGNKTMKIRY